MRSATYMIAAALTAAMSGTAAAQSAAPPPPPPVQSPTAAVVTGPTRSHWVAAAFAGSNFATTTDNLDIDSDASVNFGGQIGYLWRGIVGAEALADFAPSMDLATAAFASSPDVFSYMANAIGAYPLGAGGQIQPYLSGGFGAIQTNLGVLNGADIDARSNETTFGGNIGAGMMAFGAHVGFRTDVRYYRAMSDDTPLEDTAADTLTETVLSGLSYWRANVGLAFRW
jgi:hypothetical protein